MIAGFRFVACFFLLGLFCLSFHANAQDDGAPKASQGKMDLRYNNLSAKPISLNGEWAFYWKELLKPGDSLPTNH